MAENSLSLDEFNADYQRLRVVYLTCDEVDYELNSRGVSVPPDSDPTYVKRCCRLRELMIGETGVPNWAARLLPSDLGDDLVVCHAKFLSIEEELLQGCLEKEAFRSRLLHLGARLQITELYVVDQVKEATTDFLSKVLALYKQHFTKTYQPASSPDLSSTEDEGETDDDSLVLDTATKDQNKPGSDGKNLDNQVAGDGISGILMEIRAEIQDFKKQSAQTEAETSLRNKTFEDSLQKFNSGINSIDTMASALKKTLSEVERLRKIVSDLQSIVSVTLNVNGPETKSQLDDPCLVESPKGFSETNQHTLGGLVNPAVLQKRLPEPMKVPEILKPHVSTKSGTMNNSKNSTNADFQLQHSQSSGRQHQPVADLKFPKYAGNDDGIGLKEFLENVHHYAEIKHISDEELFSSALHLFTGPALAWYQNMRTQKRLFNWNHLVCELTANFVHPELDAALKAKASRRRQQRDESFQQYYLDMEELFRALTVPLTSREKLDILKRNLRADIKQALVLQPVNTLAELISLGKSVDASVTPIYRKAFGRYKECTTASVKPVADGYKHHKPQQGHRNISKTRIFWNRSGRPPSPEISKPSKQMDQNLPDNAHEVLTHSTQTHQVSAIDYLVDNHRPPDYGVCYNCEEKGHSHETCPFPLRVFCVICGFEEYEHSQCPYCLKNGIRSD